MVGGVVVVGGTVVVDAGGAVVEVEVVEVEVVEVVAGTEVDEVGAGSVVFVVVVLPVPNSTLSPPQAERTTRATAMAATWAGICRSLRLCGHGVCTHSRRPYGPRHPTDTES